MDDNFDIEMPDRPKYKFILDIPKIDLTKFLEEMKKVSDNPNVAPIVEPEPTDAELIEAGRWGKWAENDELSDIMIEQADEKTED